jgi:outer membrane protein assembly factor BamB
VTPAPSITTVPALYPAFSPSTTDYVIRNCPGTGGVTVDVTTQPGQYISVDGQTAQTGTFESSVDVTTGQEFTISTADGTRTIYARCLPSDFPNFTSSVSGVPQTQYFLTAPVAAGTSPASSSYLAIFDDHGVPVWWLPVTGQAIFANTQPNGDIAWTTQGGAVVKTTTLAGASAGTISSPDGPIDMHEFQTLPNGDSLVEVDVARCCTDLSSWGAGFPTDATIYDQVIEVIDPSNKVVWSWDALAHIDPVVETASQWIPSTLRPNGSYDVFHMNSVDYKNGIVLVSFRHLNAVYAINASNGAILYKLGGHEDPQSLTVVGDSIFSSGGGFCGQHDARFAWNGLITIHDNGSFCGRAPRGVAYSIDTLARTATLVGSITDSRAPSSSCCGSMSLLSGGHVVAAWGFNDLFTEMTLSGTPVYTVQYNDPGEFSYRVTPIGPGFYTAAELRSGMNAQYPR